MKKSISLLLVLVSSFQAIAQVDSTKEASSAPNHSTTFTYYVDGYYKGDFAGKTENNKTSFTNSSKTFPK